MVRAEVQLYEHEAMARPAFRNSPVRALFEGAEAIRQRLDLPTPAPSEYPVYAELRAEGMTDYLAMPMTFCDGSRHAVTWATRREGGFTRAEIRALSELLPMLAMAVEIRLNRRIARTILDTYVGRHAGSASLPARSVAAPGQRCAPPSGRAILRASPNWRSANRAIR